MKAKYAGSCEYCGGAIPAGEDCYYNLTTKKLSHHECGPKQEPKRKETPEQTARRLGFLPYADALKVDWSRYWLDPKRTLPVVHPSGGGAASPANRGDAGGDGAAHPRQDTLWPVR